MHEFLDESAGFVAGVLVFVNSTVTEPVFLKHKLE
jgi:hypothetical protein